MAEHTPTPWVYDKNHPANVYSDDATGSIVATCDGFQYAPRGTAIKAANAALIVRAVNSHQAVVDALKLCMVTLTNMGRVYNADDAPALTSTLNKARAALASAHSQEG